MKTHGVEGPRGARGPQGPAGAQGAPGEDGEHGLVDPETVELLVRGYVGDEMSDLRRVITCQRMVTVLQTGGALDVRAFGGRLLVDIDAHQSGQLGVIVQSAQMCVQMIYGGSALVSLN